ncbi:hypothetical protein [Maribellus sediminis]|uniref:hypothetical protein n=1 Tax=Maribellus sediminis TaxID=2696285 RepID=UPI0014302AEE|nr:hypothetical protein [Maribellus sediminis]
MKRSAFLGIIMLLFTFAGCVKEEFYSHEQDGEIIAEQDHFKDGPMILGKQLENPYSVENMKIAYENLQTENKLKSGLEIEATHFYVRFRPKNTKELDLITRDTTLYIYDYPLDVEIKRGGTHYHDPEIPKNEITWQYTVVPVDYVFPKVQYQKLANLYLPEYGEELTELKSTGIEHFDWLKLENEALRITGNLDENAQTENTLKSTSWRPAGNIKVFDDIINSYSTRIKVFSHYEYIYCDTGEPVNAGDPTEEVPADGDENTGEIPEGENICARPIYHYVTNSVNSHYIPLEGVEVRARRWFTTYSDITDANGNYSCNGTFSNDANYSIKWERAYYDIRDGSFGQAYFNGPNQSGDWNLNIEQGGKSIMFATIHRAAYKQFYKNNLGIRRPILSDGSKTKLCYIDEEGSGVFWGDWSSSGILPDIKVYGKYSSGSYKPTNLIFGTTSHELGHQVHSQSLGNIQYWQVNKVIYESWAEAVEWAITNDEYHSYGMTNFNHDDKQDWRRTDVQWEYSPVFIDLLDDFNQRNGGLHYGLNIPGNNNYPNDQIFGYTLADINYHILEDTYGISSLEDALKAYKLNGTTDAQIELLLELY